MSSRSARSTLAARFCAGRWRRASLRKQRQRALRARSIWRGARCAKRNGLTEVCAASCPEALAAAPCHGAGIAATRPNSAICCRSLGDAVCRKSAAWAGGGVIRPLARGGTLLGGRQRPRRSAQLGAARLLATLPAGERAPRQAVDLNEGFRSAPAPPSRPPQSAWVRALSAAKSISVISVSCPPPRSAGSCFRPPRAAPLFVERPQVLERAAAARTIVRSGRGIGPASANALKPRIAMAISRPIRHPVP